jgi:hypothetical protein
MSTAQTNSPYDALRDYLLQADERAVFRALSKSRMPWASPPPTPDDGGWSLSIAC